MPVVSLWDFPSQGWRNIWHSGWGEDTETLEGHYMDTAGSPACLDAGIDHEIFLLQMPDTSHWLPKFYS